MKLHADTFFYRIGLIIWLPILIMGSWFAQTGYSLIGNFFSCVLYEWSGLPCPGCGGTRAIVQLFSGNIIESVKYHPAVLAAICCYVHFMLNYIFRNYINFNKHKKEIHIEMYIYFLVVIIIFQWIIKIFSIIF